MQEQVQRPTLIRWGRIVALAALCSASCHSRVDEKPIPATPAAPEKPKSQLSVDFNAMQVGQAPPGFSTALTGEGAAGVWTVESDGANKVLAQTSTDDSDGRFPLCVHDGSSVKDVSVACRFKTIAGQVDQAAGVVVRYSDANNYYITRANALEGNVRLYRVVAGVRQQFAGAQQKVSSGEWHELRLDARGKHFEVFLDGAALFAADDETFSNAGKVGLWTKADSVTWFDDLNVSELRP